jgi:hypothetical protein
MFGDNDLFVKKLALLINKQLGYSVNLQKNIALNREILLFLTVQVAGF